MIPDSHLRLEDPRFLTGQGRFTADLRRDGMLHAVVVRADHAHAEIRGIDAGPALAVDGVVGVHTAADLDADGLRPFPCPTVLSDGSTAHATPRYALARERVRHVGDPVALVVAESPEAARDGAERVVIDYAPLPVLVDPLQALAADAPRLWPDLAGNLAFHFRAGDAAATRAAMAAAAHVVELDLANQRVSALPLEPRAGLAEFDPASGRFHLVATAQDQHLVRRAAAEVFDLPPERFRMTALDVGGGFGLKNFLHPEWVLLLWAARRHRRPVGWTAERGEELSGAPHGRDVQSRTRLALDADGRFLALEAEIVANIGAYLPCVGAAISTKAMPSAFGGIYAIPTVSMDVRGVFTNTTPVEAYRGAGKPESNYIIERLVDRAARETGMDPAAIRIRNALRDFPHHTPLGMVIDGGAFGANIERAVAAADRDGFEARRQASAAAGRLRGFGIGCFLETARSVPEEGAELRFTAQGRVELRIGTESNGQGHETAFVQIAADRLGLPMEAFDFIQADSDLVRMGHGHGGARSMHMGGAALVKAIDTVLARARHGAARLLQVAETSLTLDDGRFVVPDTGQSVGLLEVAAAARDADGGLDALDTFEKVTDAPFTFPNGCHVAEVEVDPETGVVEIARYLCVDDYGAMVNPMLTAGQVHGGVAQGIGQALQEHIVYDPDTGQLLSGSLMDYAAPLAGQVPSMEVHFNGVATGANPLGVKGVGQAGAIAAPQAVINAILDALAPLGVDHIDMPATPQAVWRAITAARAAG